MYNGLGIILVTLFYHERKFIKSKVKFCYWSDFVITFDELNESQIDRFVRAVMTISTCGQVNKQALRA